MERLKSTILLMLVVLGLLTPIAGAKSIGIQLREALYQEQVSGDLDAAIEIYQKVISTAAENKRYAAQAHYRLGMCYIKKGEKQKAIGNFETIIKDFSDQRPTAAKAKKELEKLKPQTSKLSEKDRIIASSYVIHYKTVGTDEDAFKIFNESHPKGVSTHHANRYRKNGQTISSICTDNESGKDKIVTMIENNPQLSLVKVESPKLVQSSNPTVISTTPPVYANDVSPDLKKITVTFDRKMADKSWSWTGGGETFPDIDGKIKYDSSYTTCTLPVKLKPGNVYWIGINSPSHKDFKTPDRIPAKRHVILFATKDKNGKPTPIPQDRLNKVKEINKKSSASSGPIYTQKMFNDIQPDGTIKGKATIVQVNKSLQTKHSYQFINSDFIHVTKMYDENDVGLEFTEKHEKDIYRYKVQLNEPWKPGDIQKHTHESEIYGLVTPVEGLDNVYQYYMRHWPATSVPTKRIETYFLPEGAEIISMIPPNMKQKTVRGRIMLTHEETVKTGTSITTSFQYRLTGAQIEYKDISEEQVEKIVRNAVQIISTCADGDPKIKSVLETLKPIEPQLVLEKIDKHLDSKSATKRRSAIYIVWKVNFKDISIVEQKLIKLCSHEENFTRGMAALALGERQATSSFDVLADMTLNDKDGFARRCGAYALGLIGNEKALPILEKALNDSDPLVKNNAEAAITMLSNLKDK